MMETKAAWYPVHNNDWAVQPTYFHFLGLNELPSRGEKTAKCEISFLRQHRDN